ncbi:FUSC family protein [Nocardioides sp.]|uniref:FUSC family protein n=1 Tax=Nocardioides sp. TaxID=35761 RepID=UPI0026380292|nr:FUSC family protein [Nocardioides sp.]
MNRHLRLIGRAIVAVAPPSPAGGVALRASFCMAVPLIALFATDHLEWALYAGFGAFAAVYGRHATYAHRLWSQLVAGGVLVTVMLIGTLVSFLDAPAPVRIVVLALVATGVNLISVAMAWAPPGPIFAVFACGACLSIPAAGSAFPAVVAIGGGTVLLTAVVTVALACRRVPWRRATAFELTWAATPYGARRSVLMGASALIAGFAAHLVVHERWYWASIAAVAAVTGTDTHSRLARGAQRFLGTAGGVVLAAALFSLDGPPVLLLGVAIVCQGVIELIVLRNYAIAMTLITLVALSMVQLSAPGPTGALVGDRLLETLIGVAVGMVLSLGLGLVVRRRAA